jgi:hypothetical protein
VGEYARHATYLITKVTSYFSSRSYYSSIV